MKETVAVIAILLSLSGCYRPSWQRENTTYSELRQDSDACKSQLIIGSTREEKIAVYEDCMVKKGYILTGSGGTQLQGKEQQKAFIHTWVYSAISTTKRYHTKDCKAISNESVKQVTVREAANDGFLPYTLCIK